MFSVMVSEISVRSRAHEIQEDWKPSFLSNEEFTHLVLEVMLLSAGFCYRDLSTALYPEYVLHNLCNFTAGSRWLHPGIFCYWKNILCI